MTVIAYDGRFVAADKQSTDSGMKVVCTKIRAKGSKAYALAGSAPRATAIMLWLQSGEGPDKFPNIAGEASVYVFERGRHVQAYEDAPVPHIIESTPWAGGCGRHAAMAAMKLGQSAEQAVLLTSEFDIYCGMGVDVIDLEEIANESGAEPGAAPPLGGTVAALAG